MQALHTLSTESTTTDSPETDGEQTSEHTCDECGGDFRIGDDEVVCTDCGLVIDDNPIDHGPEWRTFDDDTTQKTRVGAPRTEQRHDRGLGSEMGTDQSADGRKRKRLQRMKHQDRRGRFSSKKERNLAYGIGEVRRLCDSVSASGSLTSRACRLFREGHRESLAKKYSLDALAVAAVLATIREQSLPLPMSELLEYSDVERRPAHQTLNLLYSAADVQDVAPVEPVEHIPRICSGVDASDETTQLARDLTLQAQKQELHIGGNPASCAAAATYIAVKVVGEMIKQREIADVAGLSDVTVRDWYQEMLEEGVLEEVTNVGR